jgi:hypothetical protein
MMLSVLGQMSRAVRIATLINEQWVGSGHAFSHYLPHIHLTIAGGTK